LFAPSERVRAQVVDALGELAGSSIPHVVTRSAGKVVLTEATFEVVIATVAEEAVVAATTDQPVVALAS
jgi:hypothetical protein